MRVIKPGALGAALCLLIVAGAWAAPEFPELTGRVVDQAGLLSAAVEESLTGDLQRHEAETTNQVVVVTLESLGGYDIADYGFQLGRHWGIGQEGKDNGVLLIVAPSERKMRIEVGYGLEGALTDATAKSIIERVIVPKFKSGDFEDGVREGVAAILDVLGGEEWSGTDQTSDQDELTFLEIVMIAAFLIIFVVLWWASSHFGWGGGWGGGFRSGGGGFSSGGGFSGGGGSFGGGGASGGW